MNIIFLHYEVQDKAATYIGMCFLPLINKQKL